MKSIALVVILLVSGSLVAQVSGDAQSTKASSSGASQSYVIGPEDVLNVNVWKEPEMSGTIPVRPDGKISLPLLNDVQAAGLTPMQLAQQITEALQKYLEGPRVTVTVTTMNSRRVYLTGQIGRPGSMPLLKDMTVMEALSSAGCCLDFAKLKKIYVLRQEGGKPVKYPFNYKAALKGDGLEHNITLLPGDTIVVP